MLMLNAIGIHLSCDDLNRTHVGEKKKLNENENCVFSTVAKQTKSNKHDKNNTIIYNIWGVFIADWFATISEFVTVIATVSFIIFFDW